MVGGTSEAFTAASPYLKSMGSSIVHCGRCGTGQVAKVCNNMLLGISMVRGDCVLIHSILHLSLLIHFYRRLMLQFILISRAAL